VHIVSPLPQQNLTSESGFNLFFLLAYSTSPALAPVSFAELARAERPSAGICRAKEILKVKRGKFEA